MVWDIVCIWNIIFPWFSTTVTAQVVCPTTYECLVIEWSVIAAYSCKHSKNAVKQRYMDFQMIIFQLHLNCRTEMVFQFSLFIHNATFWPQSLFAIWCCRLVNSNISTYLFSFTQSQSVYFVLGQVMVRRVCCETDRGVELVTAGNGWLSFEGKRKGKCT